MNRPHYARVPALAAATSAALLLGACTPASSPDDAGAFHACLDGSSLQFTGISTDAGELSCGPDEVPVSWLAAGPADDVPQVDATAKPAGPERGEKGENGEPGEKGDDGTPGQNGLTGPSGPAGAAGEAGPSGPAGTKGATGAAGLPGRDGNSIRSGSGLPASALGIDGDFYLDTASFVVYGPKTGGAWPLGAQNLVGPQGPMGAQGVPGVQGPAGPAGAEGPQGVKGDTGDTGPIGPAGPIGPQGPQGPQGPAGAGTVFVSFLPGTMDPAAFPGGSGYFPIAGSVAPSTSRAATEIQMPRAGTITEMRVELAPRNSSVDVYLVRDGLFQPLMSCTTTLACGRTGPLTVERNQKLALWVRGAGPEPIENLRVSLLFE